MCPEARQFSLPSTSPGLERYPPEGRRFLPRGVSGVFPPPEAEEEDVNQGDLPEPDELESKEPVGVAIGRRYGPRGAEEGSRSHTEAAQLFHGKSTPVRSEPHKKWRSPGRNQG